MDLKFSQEKKQLTEQLALAEENSRERALNAQKEKQLLLEETKELSLKMETL